MLINQSYVHGMFGASYTEVLLVNTLTGMMLLQCYL